MKTQNKNLGVNPSMPKTNQKHSANFQFTRQHFHLHWWHQRIIERKRARDKNKAMGVSVANKLMDLETGNAMVVGILTFLVIVVLEAAITKVFFKSRLKSNNVMLQQEIFSRLSGWREIMQLFSGLDFHHKELFQCSTRTCNLKSPDKFMPSG